MICRSSLTPDSTAEKETNSAPAASASRRASVVLPLPGGPQRIERVERLAALDHLAEQAAGPEQMLLADELVERRGPHALGERRRRGAFLVGGSGEKVGHGAPFILEPTAD